jgi:sulfofructose kinase
MNRVNVDVLCVGHACYDITFSVGHHPDSNEKMMAEKSYNFGGGPAANAAVTVSRLGGKAAFCGYLGNDMYGNHHFDELQQEGVITDYMVRGEDATPYSTVLVKPGGKRSIVNFRTKMYHLDENHHDFSNVEFNTLLLDGHEPYIAQPLLQRAKNEKIPVILDAGSAHEGTLNLMHEVDYLVTSEDFALQYTGNNDDYQALKQLYKPGICVIITLGSAGLIWKNDDGEGTLPAFTVPVLDTTGCGDTFHGAFAYGLAKGMQWIELLEFSSAAAALCATRFGGRSGIPTGTEVRNFLQDKNNH